MRGSPLVFSMNCKISEEDARFWQEIQMLNVVHQDYLKWPNMV